jgi:DNA topoisomerase-3
MSLRTTKENKYYIGCKGYPNCKHAIWFPSSAKNVGVTTRKCGTCRGRGTVFLLQMTFDQSQIPPSIPEMLTTCVFCDDRLSQLVSRRGNDGARPPPGEVAIHRNNNRSPPMSRAPQQQQQQMRNNQQRSPPMGRGQQQQNEVLGKRPRPGPAPRGNDSGGAPNCNCGQPCRMFVCKQGANEGTVYIANMH